MSWLTPLALTSLRQGDVLAYAAREPDKGLPL